MDIDGSPDNNERLLKTQIADLQHALDNGEVLRAIHIIDAMGNQRNALASDTLVALLDSPSGLIRDHAALALEKLKSARADPPASQVPETRPYRAAENGPSFSESPGQATSVPSDKETVEAAGYEPADITPSGRRPEGPKKLSAVKVAVAGIAFLLILILVIAAGAFAYSILMPPVWQEQLPYKNSTGQFQSIVVYRNATDVTYHEVSSFVASENATLKAAVADDATERPVEYAAYLHDRAQERGINCSLAATKVRDGYPGQVLVAFNTLDYGMCYVDPTARNVSAGDYPGIDFGKIVLLRDTWTQKAGFRDADSKEVYVTVRRDASPVSYGELLQFLARDDTENATYVMPTYTCANFAATLFNRSQAQGIKCGLVSVTFEGRPVGHAFNAFPTSDKGIVLIDDTGLKSAQKNSSLAAFQTDAAVYLQEGRPLGELNLTQVDGNLDYSFYLDKTRMIEEFYDEFDAYVEDVDAHNQAIERYEADASAYTAAVNDYNAQMATHNAAVNQFNRDAQAKYSLYLAGTITYGEYSSWYDANLARIPSAPANAARIDAWKYQLDSERVRLNSEKRALDSRFDDLWDSEGRKWAVYSYWLPPEGIVNKIEYVW